MDELKKFAHWWSLLGVAGAAITAAAVNQQNPIGMYFGAALLFVGVGEWICRPEKTEIFNGPTPGSFITKRSNPWKPKLLGILFDLAGLSAFARVIYLVALAP
ncbi:hypothetical protein ACNJYA_11035 [Bradyrhizobium sp. DASA03068]|uniref:hypothetical protein n=1 Tax=Bradyrhizobium sp. BLXBL-01 TaxID=3395915 RepID=UPI003F70AF73